MSNNWEYTRCPHHEELQQKEIKEKQSLQWYKIYNACISVSITKIFDFLQSNNWIHGYIRFLQRRNSFTQCKLSC